MKIGVITKAAFLLSACLLSGVASAQTLMKRDTASTIRLAPGDMIDVQVFATPELSAKARISQDGYVDLPAIGKVSVAGMTPVQADFAVEQRLKQGHIMSDARVTILVTEYSTQGVTVLGEVTKPGTYILLGQRSLFEALAAAGGTTEKEGSTITIQHPKNPELPMETIPVDSSGSTERQQLTFVHPGDLVIVSRAKSIYVIGDVGHPGEYPLARGTQLNVLKAIALAQGTNHTASTEKTSIVRETEAGVMIIPIDLMKVVKNRRPDPVLEPGDIVVVPRSGTKAFMEYVLPTAVGGAAGATAAALAYR